MEKGQLGWIKEDTYKSPYVRIVGYAEKPLLAIVSPFCTDSSWSPKKKRVSDKLYVPKKYLASFHLSLVCFGGSALNTMLAIFSSVGKVTEKTESDSHQAPFLRLFDIL